MIIDPVHRFFTKLEFMQMQALRILYLAFISLVLAGLVALRGQETTTAIVQAIVLHGGGGVNYDRITSQQRDQLIPELKRALANRTGQGFPDCADPTSITNALIALNDDDTVLKAVGQYNKDLGYPAGLVSLAVGRESVVAALGSDLALPESVKRPDGDDVRFLPLREVSAEVILRCLQRSTEFRVATREWAAKPRIVGECWMPVCEWWDHNKAAILAHRYGDANWLPVQASLD